MLGVCFVYNHISKVFFMHIRFCSFLQSRTTSQNPKPNLFFQCAFLSPIPFLFWIFVSSEYWNYYFLHWSLLHNPWVWQVEPRTIFYFLACVKYSPKKAPNNHNLTLALECNCVLEFLLIQKFSFFFTMSKCKDWNM
jgi:hypothetical protein